MDTRSSGLTKIHLSRRLPLFLCALVLSLFSVQKSWPVSDLLASVCEVNAATFGGYQERLREELVGKDYTREVSKGEEVDEAPDNWGSLREPHWLFSTPRELDSVVGDRLKSEPVPKGQLFSYAKAVSICKKGRNINRNDIVFLLRDGIVDSLDFELYYFDEDFSLRDEPLNYDRYDRFNSGYYLLSELPQSPLGRALSSLFLNKAYAISEWKEMMGNSGYYFVECDLGEEVMLAYASKPYHYSEVLYKLNYNFNPDGISLFTVNFDKSTGAYITHDLDGLRPGSELSKEEIEAADCNKHSYRNLLFSMVERGLYESTGNRELIESYDRKVLGEAKDRLSSEHDE